MMPYWLYSWNSCLRYLIKRNHWVNSGKNHHRETFDKRLLHPLALLLLKIYLAMKFNVRSRVDKQRTSIFYYSTACKDKF